MTEDEILAQRDSLLEQGRVAEAQALEAGLLDTVENQAGPIVGQQPSNAIAPQITGLSPALILSSIKEAGHPDPEALAAQIQLNGTEENFTGIHSSLAGDADLSDIEQNFNRAIEVDIDSYNQFGGRRKARAYFMNGNLDSFDKAKIIEIESEAKVIQDENDPKVQSDIRRDLISKELMQVTTRVADRIRGSLDAE